MAPPRIYPHEAAPLKSCGAEETPAAGGAGAWYARSMQGAELHLYPEDEYVELERRAETKSELVNGVIYAMAGAKPRHNALSVNIASELRTRLRGSPCRVFSSDQRIRIEATSMNTYPDAVVSCSPRFHPKFTDALVNPIVIVEVLSKSTEDYDHGAKFAHYRSIPSFAEYVLVSQRRHQVEHFRRIEPGQWLLTVLEGDDAVLDLRSLELTIPLREIYAETDDLPGDDELDPPASA
jgi:Uma2 family endonuclease